MVTKFTVLSTQRSGSSWVIDMLNSHPNVVAYEELFLREWKERPSWAGAEDMLTWNAYWQGERGNSRAPFKALVYRKYLQQLYTARSSDVHAIGFKLMYSQVRENPVLLFWLGWEKVKVVHLVRRNFLDVLLSEESRKLRDAPHTYDSVKQVQITLDASRLLERLQAKERKVRMAQRVVRHLGVPFIDTNYEDLVEGRTSFDSLLAFLEVPQDGQGLHSSLRKMNRGTHAELILNHDEVVSALSGTRYANFIR